MQVGTFHVSVDVQICPNESIIVNMYLRFYSILSMIAAVVAFFSPAAKNSVSAVSSRNMATAAGSGTNGYYSCIGLELYRIGAYTAMC